MKEETLLFANLIPESTMNQLTENQIINRLTKIARAIDNGRLSLHGGYKNWHEYYLNMTKLVWGRNLVDGYSVFIQLDDFHLGTIKIDNNLNKMELVYHFEGKDKRIEVCMK